MRKLLHFSLFFILFFILSCTQDDTPESIHIEKDYHQEIISFKEFLQLENNNSEASKLEKYYSEGKQFKNNSNHEWRIDTTQVSKIVTKNLTIYTFAVKEYEPIEGFRNVIIKKQNGIATSHIIHYPEGIDF